MAKKRVFDVCDTDYIASIPESRRLKVDRSYKEIVGVNSFGHLNNQITLLNKANENMRQKYLDMLRPVPDLADGTENMSLRKAFDTCPSRYAQTPNEVANELLRIGEVNSPEPAPEPAPEPTPEPSPAPAPSGE